MKLNKKTSTVVVKDSSRLGEGELLGHLKRTAPHDPRIRALEKKLEEKLK